jgi:predicted phosphodiesterase
VDAVYDSTGGSVLTPDEWARAIADTARARTRAWDGDGVVGIGGHTHQVEDTRQGGVRVLILSAVTRWRYSLPRGGEFLHERTADSMNPGTATGAPPADDATMMTVTAADGAVDVTVREA